MNVFRFKIPPLSLLAILVAALVLAACARNGSVSVVNSNESSPIIPPPVLSESKAITAYSLNGESGVITGQNITVTMIAGTNTESLVATFTTTGESVTVNGVLQISGITPNNFAESPVKNYIVTAEDGSTAPYTVTVKVSTVYAYVTNAYGTNYDDSTISMYSLNGVTGELTPLSPSTISSSGNSPKAITVDPLGKYAYVANFVTNYGIVPQTSGISMYSIESTSGLLIPLSPAMISTGTYAQAIEVDPLGRYVYVVNYYGNDTISMYGMQADSGLLSPLTPESFPIEVNSDTWDIALDPSGRYAYVTAEVPESVFMYAINQSSGILEPLTPATIAASGASDIIVDPSGKYVYVADDLNNNILVYSIESSNGTLTALNSETVPTGNYPTKIAIDPSDKYLYVISNDNSISMYHLDSGSGALTPLVPATVPTGDSPSDIKVDPYGKHVYVTNNSGNNISVYDLEESSGVLTPESTVVVTNSPTSIVFVLRE